MALLNDVTGSAGAAYSLRLLDTSYSGEFIRVRRSGDSAESDFGDDGSGNLEDIVTWVDAGGGTKDGFVVTWYDQSGNGYNLTHATSSRQPQIVDNGTLLVDSNDNPRIESDLV